MKMSFWERLLRALELYCLIKKQEMGQLNMANAAIDEMSAIDPDTGELVEIDASEFYLVKNSLNAREFPKNYEVSGGVSMTIPEQTMSIREIMKRFAAGLPIDGEKVPIYEGEESDLPDLKYMDLAERQEFVENAQIELADLQAKINEDKRKKVPLKPKKDDKYKDVELPLEEDKGKDPVE